MYDFTPPVANLVNELRKIPGIGSKSAQRIVFHLLKSDKDKVMALSEAISDAVEKTRFCSICNNITEFEHCEICTSDGRDNSKICVVEEPFNILSIERTGLYRGMYHVLSGNLSPIKGVGPDELKIGSLERRLDSGEIKEVIIATSPTIEGNATAIYIFDLLKKKEIKITRIAMGLPIGADLDYVDSVTIAKSFEGRIEFK
ncbi:MAG: recombination mediator RecR [Acidobacteriota bacterium]